MSVYAGTHFKLKDGLKIKASNVFIIAWIILFGISPFGCRSTIRNTRNTITDSPVIVPTGELPTGEPTFFLFKTDSVEKFKGDKRDPSEDIKVPPHAGRPYRSGVDLETGWACVSYENKLAMIQLMNREVDWTEQALPHQVRRGFLSIMNDMIAITTNSAITVLSGPRKNILWSVDRGQSKRWLRTFGLECIEYTVPLSKNNFLLVCSRKMGLFSKPKVVIQRIDRSHGQWRLINENIVTGLTHLHQCTGDGKSLYLAGIHEMSQLGAGYDLGRLWQTIVVIKIDLDNLERHELVWEERQQAGFIIQDFAVGDELTALLINPNNEVRIYRGERTGSPEYKNYVAGAKSIEWLSKDDIVVLSDNGPQVIEIQH
jgi:hypothetical protein